MKMTDQGNIPFEHDKGYKFLLSSKKMFLELLRSFVRQGWVNQIDESDIISVDKSYILPDFQSKEADLVYRLKLKDQDIIFYVLIELQSSVEHLMPFRLLLYKTEIWRDVVKSANENEIRRMDYKLPAIVPIVLYNGESSWTANRRFRSMLAGENLFEKEMLDFEYILIDVQRYTEMELMSLSNMISSAFLLEQGASSDEFLSHARHVLNIIEQTPPKLRNQLIHWIKHIVLPRMSTENRERFKQPIEDSINTKEEPNMSMNVARNFDNLLDTTRNEGREEGRERSREEIARAMLLKGLDTPLIIEMTGLSKEKLDKLQSQ